MKYLNDKCLLGIRVIDSAKMLVSNFMDSLSVSSQISFLKKFYSPEFVTSGRAGKAFCEDL